MERKLRGPSQIAALKLCMRTSFEVLTSSRAGPRTCAGSRASSGDTAYQLSACFHRIRFAAATTARAFVTVSAAAAAAYN